MENQTVRAADLAKNRKNRRTVVCALFAMGVEEEDIRYVMDCLGVKPSVTDKDIAAAEAEMTPGNHPFPQLLFALGVIMTSEKYAGMLPNAVVLLHEALEILLNVDLMVEFALGAYGFACVTYPMLRNTEGFNPRFIWEDSIKRLMSDDRDAEEFPDDEWELRNFILETLELHVKNTLLQQGIVLDENVEVEIEHPEGSPFAKSIIGWEEPEG